MEIFFFYNYISGEPAKPGDLAREAEQYPYDYQYCSRKNQNFAQSRHIKFLPVRARKKRSRNISACIVRAFSLLPAIP